MNRGLPAHASCEILTVGPEGSTLAEDGTHSARGKGAWVLGPRLPALRSSVSPQHVRKRPTLANTSQRCFGRSEPVSSCGPRAVSGFPVLRHVDGRGREAVSATRCQPVKRGAAETGTAAEAEAAPVAPAAPVVPNAPVAHEISSHRAQRRFPTSLLVGEPPPILSLPRGPSWRRSRFEHGRGSASCAHARRFDQDELTRRRRS